MLIFSLLTYIQGLSSEFTKRLFLKATLLLNNFVFKEIFRGYRRNLSKPKMLCKPHYGNSHLEMGVCQWEAPIRGLYKIFLKNLISNFCFHIKYSERGKKCIFMNCASLNESPQQIPLRQVPFANDAKPHFSCRGFWATTTLRCSF